MVGEGQKVGAPSGILGTPIGEQPFQMGALGFGHFLQSLAKNGVGFGESISLDQLEGDMLHFAVARAGFGQGWCSW